MLVYDVQIIVFNQPTFPELFLVIGVLLHSH